MSPVPATPGHDGENDGEHDGEHDRKAAPEREKGRPTTPRHARTGRRRRRH